LRLLASSFRLLGKIASFAATLLTGNGIASLRELFDSLD